MDDEIAVSGWMRDYWEWVDDEIAVGGWMMRLLWVDG